MRKTHKALAAATLAAAVFPMAATAAPFITVSLETSTGATSVTGVTVGEVVSYEVVYNFATPSATTTNTTTNKTMSSLVTGTDGASSVHFNIQQAGTEQDLVNFAAAATLPANWQGTLSSTGSVGARNGGSGDDLLAVGATWLTSGKTGGFVPNTIVATGTFTVTQANGTTTLTPNFLTISPPNGDGGVTVNAGAFKINDGTGINTATANSDPYYGYAGLTLIAGGTASTISIAPNSGTTLFPTNTVTITNTASSGADTVTLSGLSVTTQGPNGSFGQTGLTNNSTIAAGNGNEVGTVGFNQAGLLNGITVAGNLAFSAAGTNTPATNGTQNVSDPLSTTVAGNVATANTSGDGVTFGPVLTAVLAAGTPLLNISSNTSATQGNGVVGTTATFLAGTTTAVSTTISESWRIATTAEKVGYPPVLSDVLDVTGIPNANQPGGFVYVIEMTYVPGNLGGVDPLTLNLGELVDGTWGLAVANDVTSTNETRFINTYQNSGAGLTVGDFGVDTLNHDVWAVLDHDSILAVIPEPASVGLLAVGALGLLARRRRK